MLGRQKDMHANFVIQTGVPPKGDFPRDAVLRDLTQWLASADQTSRTEHDDASIALRTKYGHKPKASE